MILRVCAKKETKKTLKLIQIQCDEKRSEVDMLLKMQDSDKMSEAKQELKKQRYNLSRKR